MSPIEYVAGTTSPVYARDAGPVAPPIGLATKTSGNGGRLPVISTASRESQEVMRRLFAIHRDPGWRGGFR